MRLLGQTSSYMLMQNSAKEPGILVSLIPVAVLVSLLALVIRTYGSGSLDGGSQVSLLAATALCTAIAMWRCRTPWGKIENAIGDNIHQVGPGIVMLLLIGALSGTWMTSGVVPTLICYGLQIIHPSFFLASTCLICALVSVMTGSSWTTIATIGVAMLGIGEAQGFGAGWIAGAIISGAYFGDKISPLSDTTVLASSATGTPLFAHIRYMMITTVPSFVMAVVIFAVAGFTTGDADPGRIEEFSSALRSSFNITPWLLVVPAVTCVMILLRLPALITLFVSALLAGAFMLIFQPQLLPGIAGDGAFVGFKALMNSIFGPTAIATGNEALDELVSTGGMQGMLYTIWLIVCAMCFGGAMTGSGMLASITRLFMKMVRRPVSAVASTACAGIFCNMCTGDQYLSIILTGKLFKDVYAERGLESRLLSRTTEDAVTVTSVIIPWNSCGMTQSTVLGVSTFVYFPYCFFNLLSPLVSIAVAALGYKIFRITPEKIHQNVVKQ